MAEAHSGAQENKISENGNDKLKDKQAGGGQGEGSGEGIYIHGIDIE